MRSRLMLVSEADGPERGSAGLIGPALSVTSHAIPTSGTSLDPD